LEGTAVNVTFCPAQIEFPGFAEIVTPAVTFGLTVIVNPFEVAGLPVTQFALLVIVQVIVLPFASEEEE
jgi:hypothetical protein